MSEAAALTEMSAQAPVTSQTGSAAVASETASSNVDNASSNSVPGKPTRFFGAVEIDPTRPVRSFEAVLASVVTELQRTSGAKVKLVLEIEAQADGGFDEADVGVVRDNARQLKFRAESTGFGD